MSKKTDDVQNIAVYCDSPEAIRQENLKREKTDSQRALMTWYSDLQLKIKESPPKSFAPNYSQKVTGVRTFGKQVTCFPKYFGDSGKTTNLFSQTALDDCGNARLTLS